MVPTLLSVSTVGLPASHRAVVREALAIAFPDLPVELTVHASVEDAIAQPSDGQRILVVDAPSRAEIDRALEVEDGGGLPRCGLVLFGADPAVPGIEALGEDDVQPRIVARALRSSWHALQLRRRFARERGDVWTLGRRFTHDLRNPLGCIVTTAEMLKEILAEDAPKHVPLVESILESTGETMELIHRIHLVAKASVQPRPAERFDMGAAHQAAVDRLQRELTRRGVELTSPPEWPEVRAVRPWVESIWANLLANSLRHAPDPLRIETGWRREGGDWVFWVADNGPGVAPERRPLLFTPFQRLHTRHGGGLGLSIVARLLDLQSGIGRFEPRPGGGSIFSFVLPAEDAGSGHASVAPGAAAGLWSGHQRLSPDGLAVSPTAAG